MYQKVTQDHKIVTHWLDHLIFISIQNQFLFIFNFSLNVLKICGYNDISRILGLGVIRRKKPATLYCRFCPNLTKYIELDKNTF